MPGRPPATRDAVVAHRLGCFCSDQGLGGASTRPEVVEAFVVAGLAGRASSTRGTYRSVLRALSGSRPAVATPFPGSGAPPPYSAAERAELFNMASAQRSAWRRSGALALVALGIGAGLRAGELVALRGRDIALGPEGVTVKVNGDRARSIVVGAPYGQAVSHLAGGDDHVFCPGPAKRAYHNFVNNFARTLVTGPGAPELCSGRCRSSFICDHLAAGTPLGELLYVAGIAEVGSLLRYARHVEGAPRSKAELRARLRGK
jgi:integrase